MEALQEWRTKRPASITRFMPALSLKAKLVISITAMVVAIVATLATFYIYEVVHTRVQETSKDAQAIAEMTEAAATGARRLISPIPRSTSTIPSRSTINSGLASDRLSRQFASRIMDWYQRHNLRHAITDTDGLVLSHDQSFLGKTIVRREDFANLVNAASAGSSS